MKEELEKMFDETFWDLWKTDVYNEEWEPLWYINNNDEVKQFIFETIIPEVLYNLIEDENLDKMLYTTDRNFYDWYLEKIEDIKQKAKELYNIDL